MKKIEVLGSGCKKCSDLAENAKKAAESLGIEYELEKVTDIVKIVGYGVMSTPALVVDGEVKFSGKLASEQEIKELL